MLAVELGGLELYVCLKQMAGTVGLEPTTYRLTAGGSAN